MRRFWDYIAFWRRWDEQERTTAIKIFGVLTAVLAVFIFIACTSYLFHWKQDKSVMSEADMMDASVQIGNAAGKLGYKTGVLFVCNLFGLGSFALIVILVAVSARLLMDKWRWSLLRTLLLVASGSVESLRGRVR